jgi:S1-C subfamily serine protease
MMKYFPRPFPQVVLPAMLFLGVLPTPGLHAQHIARSRMGPFLLSHAPQGYLGVDYRDISGSRVAALKLKDTHGVEIVTVDHDAPAGKAGLRAHDVILQMNGQALEGEAQLRRMMHDLPPGRTISFLISRDGQQQTVSVELGDRAKIEASAWPQPFPDSGQEEDSADAGPEAGNGSGPASGSNSGHSWFPSGKGFLGALHLDPLYVGVQLDAVGTQLAEYFGVHDGIGLLVHRVEENSPGSAAGLKAGDVITKVNGRLVATTSQWMKLLHENRGKPVQLTVVRNRQEQTVSMMAGEAKKKG